MACDQLTRTQYSKTRTRTGFMIIRLDLSLGYACVIFSSQSAPRLLVCQTCGAVLSRVSGQGHAAHGYVLLEYHVILSRSGIQIEEAHADHASNPRGHRPEGSLGLRYRSQGRPTESASRGCSLGWHSVV